MIEILSDAIECNHPSRNTSSLFQKLPDLALKKGLKFYETRSNSVILHETLPAYCIPKVVRMETGEVENEKVFMSPRPPPKISLKHEWKSVNTTPKMP